MHVISLNRYNSAHRTHQSDLTPPPSPLPLNPVTASERSTQSPRAIETAAIGTAWGDAKPRAAIRRWHAQPTIYERARRSPRLITQSEIRYNPLLVVNQPFVCTPNTQWTPTSPASRLIGYLDGFPPERVLARCRPPLRILNKYLYPPAAAHTAADAFTTPAAAAAATADAAVAAAAATADASAAANACAPAPQCLYDFWLNAQQHPVPYLYINIYVNFYRYRLKHLPPSALHLPLCR